MKIRAIALLMVLWCSLASAQVIIVNPPSGGGAVEVEADVPGGFPQIDEGTGKIQGTWLPYPEAFQTTPPVAGCENTQHLFIDTDQTGKLRIGGCPGGTSENVVTELYVEKISQVVIGGDAETIPDGQDGTLEFDLPASMTGSVARTDNVITVTLTPILTVCKSIEDVVAADDNLPFYTFPYAVTVTTVWAHYFGSAPSDPADFDLVGMTHNEPVAVGPTSAATPINVTAGGSVAAYTPIRMSVANTPDPEGDTYELCITATPQ